MLRVALVSLIALVGCKSKPPDCNDAVAALAKLKPDASPAHTLPAIEAAFRTRCTEDKWSQSAVTCITKIATKDDLGDCMFKHLTGEQQTKLNRATNPARESSTADAMTKLTEFKDAMCGCTDAACAQRVSEEMTSWTQEQIRQGHAPPRMSDDERARAAELGEQMGKCLHAALSRVTGAGTVTDAQRYIAKNAEFKDRLCACKDLACGRTVADELTKWSEDFLKNPSDSSAMSQAGQDQLDGIERDVRACMAALKQRSR